MGKKRVFAALLALAVTVGSLALPARAAFTDTTGHWAETAITKWSEEYSIINGYEDGTFRPDSSTPPAFTWATTGRPWPGAPSPASRR